MALLHRNSTRNSTNKSNKWCSCTETAPEILPTSATNGALAQKQHQKFYQQVQQMVLLHRNSTRNSTNKGNKWRSCTETAPEILPTSPTNGALAQKQHQKFYQQGQQMVLLHRNSTRNSTNKSNKWCSCTETAPEILPTSATNGALAQKQHQKF